MSIFFPSYQCACTSEEKKIYACVQLIPQFHVNSVVCTVGDQVLKFTPLYFDAKAEIPADWSIYVHF